MIYTIEILNDMYVVKHYDKVISTKSTLYKATKALAAYSKGRND